MHELEILNALLFEIRFLKTISRLTQTIFLFFTTSLRRHSLPEYVGFFRKIIFIEKRISFSQVENLDSLFKYTPPSYKKLLFLKKSLRTYFTRYRNVDFWFVIDLIQICTGSTACRSLPPSHFVPQNWLRCWRFYYFSAIIPFTIILLHFPSSFKKKNKKKRNVAIFSPSHRNYILLKRFHL